MPAKSGYSTRKKPRWGLISAIVAGHVLVLIGLARALAPDFTAQVVEGATSLVTVTVSTPTPMPTPPPPPPDPAPEPEGAAGPQGERATPREVTAPEPPIKLPDRQPAPRASSTGDANRSGASERGDGTGAGGDGNGTGSGNGGDGSGGGGESPIVSRPSLRSGSLNESRDFPTPEGGRRVRFGTSITVYFLVGVDGRARNCRVTDPGPDPATNAALCRLVEQKLTFNPARRANGEPVEAEYGWVQRFGRK